MKNKKILQTAIKMLIALLIGIFFYYTKESEHHLISFIGLGMALVLSIIIYQRTFPILISALSFLFISAYMQLFNIKALFLLKYNTYLHLGLWLLIFGFIVLFLEELSLILKKK